MYIVGTHHPNRTRATTTMARAIADSERLVIDAEVLQEILHRYVSIRRLDAVGPAMAAILDQVDAVFPMEREDVTLAAEIVRTSRLSARDAIHVAVMRRRGVTRIMTFDRGFDGVEGIERYRG